MRVYVGILLLLLIECCVFGSNEPDAQRIVDLRKRYATELAVLGKFREKPTDYSNGDNVLRAAQKFFGQADLTGLSRTSITSLLGPPDAAPLSPPRSAKYTYGNGEQFVIRRFHFDSDGHVENVEKILSQ
jgi:hypothetical protein